MKKSLIVNFKIKRFMLVLLAFLLLLLIFTSIKVDKISKVEAKEGPHDGLYYDLHNGTYRVVDCDTSVTSVIIPATLNDVPVTSIFNEFGDPGGAFTGCINLQSITIPNSIAEILPQAFSGCPSLSNIIVAEDNPNFLSDGDVLYDKAKTTLYCYPSKKIETHYELPISVTEISEYAFDNCIYLNQVIIPSNSQLSKIHTEAFSGCKHLNSIFIPSGVTIISPDSFMGCTSLSNVTVDENSNSFSSVNGVLYNKNQTELKYYPANKDWDASLIPGTVTKIGDYAFAYNKKITEVILPTTINSISIGAFSNCTSLKSIIIPSGVTTLNSATFSNCSSLTSVEIPNGTTLIRGNIFTNCYSLTWVKIPGSVQTIDQNAFKNCVNLTSITMEGATPPTLHASAFSNSGIGMNADNHASIFVPFANISDYTSASVWSNYYGKIRADVEEYLTFNLYGGEFTGYTSIHSGIGYVGYPIRKGYTFTGWSGGGLPQNTMNLTFDINTTSSKTYDANWDLDSYIISYNLNGGTNNASNPYDYTFNSLDIELNAPTRDGYNFIGWSGAGLTGNHLTVTIPTGSTGDRLFTANWAPKTNMSYKIEYHQQNIGDDGYTLFFEDDSPTGTTGQTVYVENYLNKYEGFTYESNGSILSGVIPAVSELTLKVYYNRNKYKVNFVDFNNFPVIGEQEVKHGGNAIAPANSPTRAGYEFANWDTIFTNVTKALTVKATYTANTNTKYTIQYYQQNIGNNEYTLIHTDNTKTGTTDTIASILNYENKYTGFTFTTNNSITSGTITGDGLLVLTAYYNRNKYTVTFVDYNDSQIEVQEDIKYGDSAVEPSPNPGRAGYEFAGWDTIFTNVTKTLTVKATYTANTNTKYTIQYYQQNIGNNEYTLIHTDNTKTGTTDTIASILNYENKYTGFTFTTNNSILSGTILANGSLILKAYYNRIIYVATFVNDGNPNYDVQNLRYGANIVKPNDPTKSATAEFTYTFSKWDKDIPDTISDNITFEAIYTETRNTFEVTFNYGENSTTTQNVGYGFAATAPTNTEKAGYTFKKWNKTFTNITTALTVTAEYDINDYTITFNSNGGSAVEAKIQAYQSLVQKPEDPTKQGYIFDNWYTDNGVFENIFVFNNMPLNGATLYAKWNPREDTTYCIKYYQQNINDDYYTELTPIYSQGTTGTTVNLTGLVGRYEGFTYILEGSTPTGEILANGSLTLKAYYNRNSYTITFKNEGAVHNTQTLRYGATLATVSNPEQPATQQYTYTFTSWSKEVPTTMPADNITLIARYLRTTNKYKVTFEDHDKSVLRTEYVEYDLDAQAPANPSRIGYNFTGWSTSFAKVKETLLVKAMYEINSYTITFNSNGGSNVAAKTQDYDTTVEAPADPTMDGYDFLGWYIDNETFLTAFEFNKMPANNTTVYANWKPKDNTPFSIKYYLQSAEEPPTYVLEKVDDNHAGTTGIIVTATGYENKYDGFSFNSIDSIVSGIIAGDGSLTLEIYYTRNTYSIAYINDGSVHYQKLAYYDEVLPGASVPTKAGYEFGGWYTKPNGDGVLFDVDAHMPASDVTYYANWIVNLNTKYKIEYYKQNIANNEYTLFESDETKFGETDTIVSIPNYDNRYVGFSYTSINSMLSGKILGDESLVLKAYYTRNIYTITFINGDTEHDRQTKKYGDAIINPDNPTKASTLQYTYTFKGWDDNIPETMPAENITLFATYTSKTNKYRVTFVNHDNTSILKTQEVEYGLNATAPEAPALTGYAFSKWDADFTKVTRHILVTAKYNICQFIITFNSNGGTAVSQITEDYNDKVIAPKNPTKKGYAFDGWYKNAALTNSYVFTSMPAENITLYAKWIKVVDIASFIADSDVKEELQDVEIIVGKEYETLSSLKESHKDAKQGYTLTNWIYKDVATGNESDVTSETMFDYETGFEILATYEANQYTLNCYLNYNDAEDIAAITVTYDSQIILPETPTREGYTFLGWYNGNQKVEDGDLYVSSNDMSLVARWEESTVDTPSVSSGPNLLWLYILLSIFGGAGLTVGTYFLVKFIEKKKKA